MPNLFTPWPNRNDRGKALEQGWQKQLDCALHRPFACLREDERTGRIPSLVFTPMIVEDGRRLIISNLDMRDVITNEGRLLREPSEPSESEKQAKTNRWDDTRCHSRDALELFRLFPEAPETFRLSTAVRMSASFPLLSPAVSLPVTPRRRVVDAGYYDNYGVNLAATWLMSVSRKDGANSWLANNSASNARVLFVQIRDGLDNSPRKLRKIASEDSNRLSRAAEELTSPFEGLLNARVASSSFRNDALLNLFGRVLNTDLGEAGEGPDVGLYRVVNFEFTEDAALSWYLAPSEKEKVRNGMKKKGDKPDINYEERVESVKRWWKGERNPAVADASPPGR